MKVIRESNIMLANPIILRITPMTVVEAIRQKITEAIYIDNPSSPPGAGIIYHCNDIYYSSGGMLKKALQLYVHSLL